jgi:hypothetical protein
VKHASLCVCFLALIRLSKVEKTSKERRRSGGETKPTQGQTTKKKKREKQQNSPPSISEYISLPLSSLRLITQRNRLGPDIISEINRIRRIATRHQRQLPRRVIDKDISKHVPTRHILRLLRRRGVSRAEGLGVDGLQHAAGVADEVEEEEKSWMGLSVGGSLHQGVGFEGTF